MGGGEMIFFFQAEDGIRDLTVTGVQTCALPISCGKCYYCKKGIYAHCENDGGWILGHLIDGTQAEYVKVPFADNSLYHRSEERRVGKECRSRWSPYH